MNSTNLQHDTDRATITTVAEWTGGKPLTRYDLITLTKALKDNWDFPVEMIADLGEVLKEELKTSNIRKKRRVIECIEALNESGLASSRIDI